MTAYDDSDEPPAGLDADLGLRTASTHWLSGPRRPAGERHAYRLGRGLSLCGRILGTELRPFPDTPWGEGTMDTVACMHCTAASSDLAASPE